ncbi:hypothetical protein Ancab_010764 [Ancistrocladus abbreviatus]
MFSFTMRPSSRGHDHYSKSCSALSFISLLLVVFIIVFALTLYIKSSSSVSILLSPSYNNTLESETTSVNLLDRLVDVSPAAATSYNGSFEDLHVVVNGTVATDLHPSIAPKATGGRKPWRIETGLTRARSSIREAAQNRSLISAHQDPDYIPQGPIYRNANAFHRSYLEMEKVFKIYVYREGEHPLFHNGHCKSLYSSEGRFINEMEKPGNKFTTADPEKAHVYFLPFSVVMMVQYLHEPGSHDIHPIGRTIADYVHTISHKYPFWSRSLGADHFMLSCHDWGPWATTYVPQLYNNSIRALCNANTSEGFNPARDVSFPEINLLTGEVVANSLGGLPPSQRSILAFFAGRLHGHIRQLLLQHWKDKDNDIQVYEQLPLGISYDTMLKKSRFCLCPSGYEVASPRVVEAIYAECIPVLISENYVLPFNDVLNWKSFSIQVDVQDIPNIKSILMGISPRQYLRMQRRVKQVRRHFMVNSTPKRFDVFHMIIHSVWLRRLNIFVQG